MERGRLEAFSDGVFSVAITLLALNLSVAGPGHGSLLSQLGHHWPSFVAYVVSFFNIGVIWVNHHAFFKGLAQIDHTLLFLNLMLLLFVVAIPFFTSTMAVYVQAGGEDAHIAAALYSMVMQGMAISFALIYGWSMRQKLVVEPPNPKQAKEVVIRSGVGLVAYLVAIGAAFISAPLALGINGLIAAYYVFEQSPAQRRESSSSE